MKEGSKVVIAISEEKVKMSNKSQKEEKEEREKEGGLQS